MKRWIGLSIAAILVGCETTPLAPLPPNTSLKVYEKEVYARMNAVWNRIATQHEDELSLGTLRLQFRLFPDGRISGVHIASNSSNNVLVEIAQRTIAEAALPPIPPAALRELPHGYMPGDCSFTVYPLP